MPGEGYVTLSAKLVKSKKTSTGYADVVLLNSKKRSFTNSKLYISTYGTVSASKKYAVSKGTYYINMCDFGGKGVSVQVKYTFTSITQPNNFSIGRAEKLEAGKTVSIYRTPNETYDRWFKISLTKKKKITCKTAMYCSIYNSNGNPLTAVYMAGSTYQSGSVLKPGTYYIKVYSDDGVKVFNSAIYTLKWS